jgi:hypothetical protein
MELFDLFKMNSRETKMLKPIRTVAVAALSVRQGA